MAEDRKIKLSSSILEMKFMKKTKEKVQKEEEDAEGNAMYSSQITEEMKRTGNLIFIPASITNCKGLIDGRLSFGGMNPDIEKLMENDYVKQLEHIEKNKEKDISDQQMAEGYSTVVHTISNKFNKKKNRNKQFIKPSNNEPLI